MMQNNRFREDMLDLEDPAAGSDVVYIAGPAAAARTDGSGVVLTVPMFACRASSFEADPAVPAMTALLRIQSWGGCMVRTTVRFDGDGTEDRDDLDQSPM